ncbi:hypothetical protein CERZMDRAFT_90107 [Cercospora zeae-maydis SCOH1-5]|uniref:Uncharacterized protein n=1 Tax=Cercospora zeae-maydis SCOH1-5 TaxID=717836 RepID=A0A6A6FPD5_9PEZI|nr:hypothetical protein CERZMDRAFT_90107 [Cercospora zeae-maydis SCOH1-5]
MGHHSTLPNKNQHMHAFAEIFSALKEAKARLSQIVIALPQQRSLDLGPGFELLRFVQIYFVETDGGNSGSCLHFVVRAYRSFFSLSLQIYIP